MILGRVRRVWRVSVFLREVVLRSLLLAFALSSGLAVAGCSQLSSWFGGEAPLADPFQAADYADTRVLAGCGLTAIVLEEAASLVENPATPDQVVDVVARIAPVLKESCDAAQFAAVEYRLARDSYEQAKAAGLPEQAALLQVAVGKGVRVAELVSVTRAHLSDLSAAFEGVRAPSARIEQADALFEESQALLGVAVSEEVVQ